MDDLDLIQRIRNEDAQAWNELIRRYERLVYAIPRRLGLGQADVEEVFQNTWILLHAHLAHIRDTTRLRSWLSTTARRETWRLQRKARTDLDIDELPVHDDQTDPGDDLEQLELREALRVGLESLRAPCQELLTLLFLAPATPSYSDAAAQLGMPVGSLGPTRARCLADLAQLLENQGF